MHSEHIAELTNRYLAVPSVVGFEEPFIAALEADLDRIGRPHHRTAGLLAVPGHGWTVSAHIDRHGLVTDTGGVLRYAAAEIGEHRTLGPRARTAVCTRFADEDVAAYDPATGVPVATATVDHGDHCGLDHSAELFAEPFTDLPAGVPVAFAAPASPPREGWISGQLDNTVSAAMAIALLEAGFGGTVLFTLGEEIGRSWEALVDWFDEPERRLLVLDTSPFDDEAPAADGAAVLRHRDAGAAFDAETVALVEATADEVGVPVIWKDRLLEAHQKPLGRTELGRLVAGTDGRATGATLQIPTTDYHSNHETTSYVAIDNVWHLLTSVLDV